ncbi:MAG TPA: hypothetical protein VK773_00130 [Acidimicrobiales bacterium]|jgi:hypothetical protein|nr:hypothetical protein [Acidimicrobiales bacterium]
MIAAHVLSVAFGAILALAILGSALKTVVLPQEGFPRLAQAVFAAVHRLLVHHSQSRERASALRSLYAPVALVSLPLVWMLSMVVAFTFIFWGTGSLTWQRAFEISGSSLTTLGFAEPSGTGRIWLAIIDATIGLGLVALLISYLPTIYGAYNAREKGIIRLRPVSGAPPAVVSLLLNLQRIGALENAEFWRNQSEWILDIEQTHTAFPILTYFPETHQDHSWVATIGTLLDAAALVISSSETQRGASFEDIEKGPMMVLVYGMPGFVRVAHAASIPIGEPMGIAEVVGHFDDPAPPIAITRAEYDEAMTAVAPIIGVAPEHTEDAWRRFAWIRSSYEPAIRSLAGLTFAYPAPWTTDRAAKVGRPRFLRRRVIAVDWSVNVTEPDDAESAAPAAPASPTGG